MASASIDLGANTANAATNLTQGSVVFAGPSGVLSQDNSNFFWDDTNNRLGIGTTIPQVQLHVGATSGAARVYNSFTDASNGEWGEFAWSSNVLNIGTNKNGTGTSRSISIRTDGTEAVRVSTSQEIGIGNIAPTARFHIAGTYTTSNANLSIIAGTLSTSNTGSITGLNVSPTFTPTGASSAAVQGGFFSITYNNTSITPGALASISGGVTIGASYTGGDLADVRIFSANTATVSAGTIATFRQYFAQAVTNGNGASSGTITNEQIRASGITAGSAGATINNRSIFVTVPSGGASSGTANNRGIYITGNGGTASGGTVNNFALFSDSTAPMQIGGLFQFLGSTSSFPALKRSSTRLEVRLADDSGYAGMNAANIGHQGVAFASLPAGVAGMTAYVTDSNTATWAATIAGGGANKVLAFYNGTNWTVAGA